jgi:hypothetical protein
MWVDTKQHINRGRREGAHQMHQTDSDVMSAAKSPESCVDRCPDPAIQKPVNTHDTAKTGTVCHRYSILATIPVPVKPVGRIPWVYLYLCYTLLAGDIQELMLVLTELQHMIFVYPNRQLFSVEEMILSVIL